MALPIVRLADIPEEGLNLDCELLPEDIALTETDAKVRERLSLSAGLSKIGKIVAVQGAIGGTFVRQCVRCLKDYEIFVRVPFTVEYHRSITEAAKVAEGGNPRTEEFDSVTEPDPDAYDYTGEQVDLAAMLREQLILATPMQPLCAEDCRGLCPTCGQDRNVSSCDCPEPVPANPFVALQQLRDNLQNPARAMRQSKAGPSRN